MTVATVTEAVDCDLHVAPTGVDTILPFLDEYWRSYIDDATIRMGQAAYPMGAATTGGVPAGTHEEVAAVLDETQPRRAILSCLALDGVHRNPHYGAAMATAINTWMRDEFLERDDRLRAGLAVSTLDIPAAVAEIERWDGDARFAQILMPVRNDVPYGNRLYHPLYEAAQRHGLPIALHAWGRGGHAPTTMEVPVHLLWLE